VQGRTAVVNHLAPWKACALAMALVAIAARGVSADESTEPTEQDPVSISADFAHEWSEGSDRVSVLRGHCRIVQGGSSFTAQKAVVWHRPRREGASALDRLSVYLEGDVRLVAPRQSSSESSLLVHFNTAQDVSYNMRHRRADVKLTDDPLVSRAQARIRNNVRGNLQQTQLIVPPAETESDPRTVQIQQPPGNRRRIRFIQRSPMNFSLFTLPSQDTTPAERVTVIRGGVILLIEGVQADEFGELGTIDLAADRIVLWTLDDGTGSFEEVQEQSRDTPFQVYLEGNIVIRQGQRVVRATHAFYDARDERALLLNAELRTFIPQIGRDLRVRADRIRQLSRDKFHARNAWATTSPYGKPGYRLQASDIYFERRLGDPVFGAPEIDPLTGAAVPESVPWITSSNNTFLFGDIPLLYLPQLSFPAEDPNIPLRSITVENDQIFGGQLRTIWNLNRLLGVEEIPDTRWDLLADFLSRRGPAIGTGGEYNGLEIYGIPGIASGEGLAYYINDGGRDNLGADRRSLAPENDDRWRAQLRHRQDLPYNFTVLGEIGVLSDRNFLEQYFEQEFDEGKDVETLIYGKQYLDNWAWTAIGRPQTNEFQNTTEWLPRGDLYVLSEPILGGSVTWSSHTSAGYGHLVRGDPPTDPADVFVPIPYINEAKGAVLMTRHEVDAPFNLGPVQFVPYLMGEAAYWGEDFNGNDIDRLVANAGLRSSVFFWRLFPFVQSRILNLNGLAHKIRLEGEYSWIESTRDLNEIPQFNEIDDNAQEKFRERYPFNTFGLMGFPGTVMLPPQFDPRFYAVRTGAGASVTAPWHELVDDQQVFRAALRQRLQTKVGPPERRRIKDWMRLDLEATYFPNPGRDNFGEDLGLLSGRYRWNVGERTSLLADAYYDLFAGAQELWSVGVLSQRSTRGSAYVGVRQVKGAALDSRILSASYSYRMSPKWVSTAGTAYDLAEGQDRGQSLTITRVGLDFLIHFGANYDRSKDNAGIAIAIEPRFGAFDASSAQLSSLLGIR